MTRSSSNNGNKIVVKVEIQTLSDIHGKLDVQKLDRLAMVLSNLHNSGKHILVVSSGAIALGAIRLQLSALPEKLIDKQATAAIGQAELIKNYQTYFEIYNQIVAQVLLTKDVMSNELRRENAQNTFNTLLDMNIIPVINENDTVSTDDIEMEDNYPLAKNVAELSGANMMIIKSETEGSYYILLKGKKEVTKVESDEKLIWVVEQLYKEYQLVQNNENAFPLKMSDIIFN